MNFNNLLPPIEAIEVMLIATLYWMGIVFIIEAIIHVFTEIYGKDK